jgi:hypothetical protein
VLVVTGEGDVDVVVGLGDVAMSCASRGEHVCAGELDGALVADVLVLQSDGLVVCAEVLPGSVVVETFMVVAGSVVEDKFEFPAPGCVRTQGSTEFTNLRVRVTGVSPGTVALRIHEGDLL